MMKFEVFTQNSHDAGDIASEWDGVVSTYNVDEGDYFIVTFVSPFKPDDVTSCLLCYDIEEVITTNL